MLHRPILLSCLLLALAGCSTAPQTDEAASAPEPPSDVAVSTSDAIAEDVQLSQAPPTGAALPPPMAPLPAAKIAGNIGSARGRYATARMPTPPANTENYEHQEDNPIHRVSEQPLSTFSIDVDTGSYANVRRMLRNGQRPPADAVRTEEFLNYFDYGHAGPSNRNAPFRVNTEVATAPWNSKRQLLMVGIKGYDVPKAAMPASNLVFLIDTSGSMNDPDKLPLVKTALRKLIPQLRAQDRVSMVAYAGSAGLVLPPTPGDRHEEILRALDELQAGGSTNGGEGIQLAYAMARQAFVKGGVNRVILATDGDFNVGVVDRKALETLVADNRKTGVALSTLGFGTGNYNDAMAERLADVGDGNHSYIDSEREAEKVLVSEMRATLLTIARDVKIQVEFNPAQVAEYRLIGYENRALKNEDFANDKVDAGDIGAGHQVTALYEIALVGSGGEQLPKLRYGIDKAPQLTATSKELAHLRLRYKRPGEDTSSLIETPIAMANAKRAPSTRLQFAAGVAAFADALRGGERIGMEWDGIQKLTAASLPDPYGDRAELRDLVRQARQIVQPGASRPKISD